jgi:hypothetical protein
MHNDLRVANACTCCALLQGGAQAQTHTVPLEKVIDDIVNMGFSRHEVRGVVTKLMESGQSIDLNIVLDRLMNGMR